MIRVNEQYFFSEKGKRSNNEDNYGLLKEKVYVLCDGVGGAEKGEIASGTVVRTFMEMLSQNPDSPIEEVLLSSELRLSEHVENHHDAEGMATTLTCSQIFENGIRLAWVGDSRIYQFRDGKILFRTTDHSWVNEAIREGIITAEEAIGHPKSNVITRAIQGTHHSVCADEIWISDIKEGDHFLHCSDGVIESWNDADLSALFSSGMNTQDILERIRVDCQENSKDNFTAILYSIGSVSVKQQDIEGFKKNFITDPIDADKSYSKDIWKYLFYAAAIVVLILIVVVIILSKSDNKGRIKNINPKQNITVDKKRRQTS